MGTHRLKRLDTGDFYRWLHRLGYNSEMEFWASLSGLSSGTVFDHMDSYLTSLGYSGHPDDKFRQFLMDQITAQGASLTNLGTLYDLANCLYDLGFDSGGVPLNAIHDDDGNVVRDDDGNIILDDT